jgi:hypothetical protein
MAKQQPNHHILSVELLRTPQNETVVVFTVATKRGPVQYVLKGDAAGGKPRAYVSDPHHRLVRCKSHHTEPAPHGANALLDAEAEAPIAFAANDDPASADAIALGVPPPKEEPPPGIVALGTVLLASAFNLGEQVSSSPTAPR